MCKYKDYTMILPTYNEESRVKRIVDYYKFFARIIVVDNESTDNTVEVVNSCGVEVVSYKNSGTIQTPECYKFLASIVDTKYLALLSCSEFIPPRLLDYFEEVASNQSCDVVACVRDSYTSGELVPLWGGRFGIEARIERFFNKEGIDFDKVEIHKELVPLSKDRIVRLNREDGYVVAHFRDVDAVSLMNKGVGYGSTEANHREGRGARITLFKLLLLFAKEFLRVFYVPPTKWGLVAFREIWARMVMHTVTYWVGLEIKTGQTLEVSRSQNNKLWESLAASKDKNS